LCFEPDAASQLHPPRTYGDLSGVVSVIWTGQRLFFARSERVPCQCTAAREPPPVCTPLSACIFCCAALLCRIRSWFVRAVPRALARPPETGGGRAAGGAFCRCAGSCGIVCACRRLKLVIIDSFPTTVCCYLEVT
jgi:hypothetical protein